MLQTKEMRKEYPEDLKCYQNTKKSLSGINPNWFYEDKVLHAPETSTLLENLQIVHGDKSY